MICIHGKFCCQLILQVHAVGNITKDESMQMKDYIIVYSVCPPDNNL